MPTHMIEFSCGHCGGLIHARDNAGGMAVKCPLCQEDLVVPAAVEAAPVEPVSVAPVVSGPPPPLPPSSIYAPPIGAPERRKSPVGIVLAALMTCISVGLLGLSSVLPVKSLGVTVAIGIFLSLVLSPLIRTWDDGPGLRGNDEN